uniref:FHA domain-containing protein n=1 Tax=Pseudothermotoga hypogea TaxID=57487 RepID=A0A832IEC5_9THEM
MKDETKTSDSVQNKALDSSMKDDGDINVPNLTLNQPAPQASTPERIRERIRLKVYKEGQIVLEGVFSYDEILIGRSRTGVDVDINLRDLDEERETSRKHLKIVKNEDGTYSIVRLSWKAPVYLNKEPVKLGESRELYDQDRIVLGRSIGLKVEKV